MAVIAGGKQRMGETVHVPMPDKTIKAVIGGTVFYDPEGARLNV